MRLDESEPHAGPPPSGEAGSPPTRRVVVDDLHLLLSVLPPHVQEWLEQLGDTQGLLEVILDLGRAPQARFRTREEVGDREVTEQEILSVVSGISPFGDDNRAGIERTLHRISCIRNRGDKIVGLSCRVGRAVFGTIQAIEDLVLSSKSVLLLGRPGVGKTTMLREVARVLADSARKRVVVVDTSNEIAGDGDIPHPAIGRARRMQVKTPSLQHAVMIEAVENHMPEAIVIDEMGTEQEAAAARTIAERGVQLIATAHGNTLDNLILNPTLSDLVGGVQTVTLGDEEARRRGTRKTVLERKAPPTFEVVVEIQSWDQVAVHMDIASTVDALLRGYSVTPEVRSMDAEGRIHFEAGEPLTLASVAPPRRGGWGGPSSRGRPNVDPSEPVEPPPDAGLAATAPVPFAPPAEPEPVRPPAASRVFPYGISRDRLLHASRHFGIGAEVASSVQAADMVLTTKSHYRKKSEPLKVAQERGIPIYVLRKNTQVQIEQFLKSLSMGWGNHPRDRMASALEEAEEAVGQIMGGEPSVELRPQSSYVRRLQHMLGERYNLSSVSMGRDPQRRVIMFRQ